MELKSIKAFLEEKFGEKDDELYESNVVESLVIALKATSDTLVREYNGKRDTKSSYKSLQQILKSIGDKL